MLVVGLLAGTFVLGHIVRYDYAAIYYNLLETVAPPSRRAIITWVPNAHLAARGPVRGSRACTSGRLGADRVLQTSPGRPGPPQDPRPGWFGPPGVARPFADPA